MFPILYYFMKRLHMTTKEEILIYEMWTLKCISCFSVSQVSHTNFVCISGLQNTGCTDVFSTVSTQTSTFLGPIIKKKHSSYERYFMQNLILTNNYLIRIFCAFHGRCQLLHLAAIYQNTRNLGAFMVLPDLRLRLTG